MLLAVVVGALWFRSYNGRDMLRYHTAGGNRIGWISSGGSVAVEVHTNEVYYDPRRPRGAHWDADGYVQDFRVSEWTTPTQWRLGSFRLVINRGVVSPGQASARPGGWQNSVVVAPLWVCFAVSLASALLCAWRLRRLGPVRGPGFCRVCGYDLRATKERCPECGAEVNGNHAGSTSLTPERVA